MEETVLCYNETKDRLLKYFSCAEDYFIRVMDGYSWEITEEDGIAFLSYWENSNVKTTAVVIKREDKPLLFKTSDSTMVIAIDCVKIGFIFSNRLNRLPS